MVPKVVPFDCVSVNKLGIPIKFSKLSNVPNASKAASQKLVPIKAGKSYFLANRTLQTEFSNALNRNGKISNKLFEFLNDSFAVKRAN